MLSMLAAIIALETLSKLVGMFIFLDTELVTVNTTEGAAFGAALLAGVGAGIYNDVISACESTIQITGRTNPGDAKNVYKDYYPIYRELYPSLSKQYENIAGLVG